MHLSLVISIYNEQQVLPLFYREVTRCLKGLETSYELVMVDDGSTDNSIKYCNRWLSGMSVLK
jgi:glycosyltransferase involved in cell wall biosynthesis